MHLDSKKRLSFLALCLAAGDLNLLEVINMNFVLFTTCR